MRTVFTPLHALHAPATEFFRGERVPCFEKVDRARYVHEALTARGHRVDAPEVDSRAVLPQAPLFRVGGCDSHDRIQVGEIAVGNVIAPFTA